MGSRVTGLLPYLGSLLVLVGQACGHSAFAQQLFPVTRDLTNEERQKLGMAEQAFVRAGTLANRGDTAAAAEQMQSCVELAISVLGNDFDGVAGLYSDWAYMLEVTGAYDQAVELRQKSLDSAAKKLPKDSLDLATLRQLLGNCLTNAGQAAKAEPHLLAALESVKATQGPDSLYYTVLLSNVGAMYLTQEQYAKAKPYYKEALDRREKLASCPLELLATAENNLGEVLTYLADFPAARTHLDKAMDILRRSTGLETVNAASTYNNLGYLSACQGDYNTALDYYAKSLGLRRKLLKSNDVQIGESLTNRGAAHMALGDHKEAADDFNTAFEILSAQLPIGHPRLANVITLYSEGMYKAGKYAEARALVQQATQIQEQSLGSSSPSVGYSFYNAGVLAMHEGNPTAAELYLGEGVHRLRLALGDEYFGLTKLYDAQGALYASNEDTARALVSFDSSQRIVRNHARNVLPGIPSDEQLKYRAMIAKRWNTALSFAWRSADLPEVRTSAAEWVVNNKAIAHEALADQTQLQFLSGTDNPIATSLMQTRQELAAIQMAEPPTDGAQEERRQKIATLRAKESELSRKLARQRPSLIDNAKWCSLGEVQSRIPDRAVLVEYVRITPWYFDTSTHTFPSTPDHYIAFVIPAEGGGPVSLIDIGPATEIDELIESSRKMIAEDTGKNARLETEGEAIATEAVHQLLGELAKRIYAPVAQELGDVEKLLLSPDSNLWLVPWAALPTGDGEEVLIEQFTLQMLTSSRTLLPADTQVEIPASEPRIFADPDYDLDPSAIDKQLRELDIDKNRTPRSTRSIERSFHSVERLLRTNDEADRITPYVESLTGKKPVVLRRSHALEAVAKASRNPELLVFATHGKYFEATSVPVPELPIRNRTFGDLARLSGGATSDPFLQCVLLLAGCNKSGSDALDDGILTGVEILAMDLRATRLVVLSACETSLGEVRTGEGVAGLRMAFQLAGAKAVVGSLWSVEDRETALLMTSFFEHMANGEQGPEALRSAQLERIRERRLLYGAAHPYFWAGITYAGK